MSRHTSTSVSKSFCGLWILHPDVRLDLRDESIRLTDEGRISRRCNKRRVEVNELPLFELDRVALITKMECLKVTPKTSIVLPSPGYLDMAFVSPRGFESNRTGVMFWHRRSLLKVLTGSNNACAVLPLGMAAETVHMRQMAGVLKDTRCLPFDTSYPLPSLLCIFRMSFRSSQVRSSIGRV